MQNEIEHSIKQKQVSINNMVITSLLGGAFAGALAKSVIAPLDRTKINFQIQEKVFNFREAYLFLAQSYKNFGLINLWRGNSATLVRVVPYAAIQYTSHEQFKRLLQVDTFAEKKAHPLKSYLAGSLAGVVSTTATYPLDLARARMAVFQKEVYNSLTEVFIKTIKNEGFRTLYRGYLPTVLGVIPYSGTGFFTYEKLKLVHYEITGNKDPNPLMRLTFGAIAGLLGQSSSYPLDIVRRRMQTRQGYTSIIQTIKKVTHEEGIYGLYKGLSMNWIKGPIAVGVSFTTFDVITNFLRSLSFFTSR